MTEKKARNPEALGISGFTLGIVSIAMVIFIPLVGIISGIVGFIFCRIQQKKHLTRTAKIGATLNIIGVLVNIVWWIVLVKYVYPLIEQFMGQASAA